MERLTVRTKYGEPYYKHCAIEVCDTKCYECDFDYKILQKVAKYEDLEEQLEKVYGECEGLLETAINSLIKHEGAEIGTPKKARLLTDEDVDRWESFKNAEEQGLLLRLPCRLGDIIDRIISHNETVTLMFEIEVSSFRGLQHFWHGAAWNIPKEYLELPFVKIHGVVPDKITEADIIWIEVRKEAEQALARTEGENE